MVDDNNTRDNARDRKRKRTLVELASGVEVVDLDAWTDSGFTRVYTIDDAPVKDEDGMTPIAGSNWTRGSSDRTSTTPLTGLPAVSVSQMADDHGNAPDAEPQGTHDPNTRALSDTATDETQQSISRPAPVMTSDEASRPKSSGGAETTAVAHRKPATVIEIEDEPEEAPKHSTEDDAIPLDDDKDAVVTTPPRNTAPRSEVGPSRLAEQPSASGAVAESVTSDATADAMDIDQAPQQTRTSPNSGKCGITSPTGGVTSSPAGAAEDGAQGRRGPANRITSARYRKDMHAVMRQIAAKRIAGGKIPKTPAIDAVAGVSITNECRQTDTARASPGDDVGSLGEASVHRAAAGSSMDTAFAENSDVTSQRKASGAGGDPDSSDDDSGGDNDEDGNQSDEGLFVNDSIRAVDRDDDVDADMDDETDEQRAAREKREFEKVKARFKKAERQIKKVRKTCGDEETAMVEEVKFMSIQKEYDLAVQKRKRIMEREKAPCAGDDDGNDDDDDPSSEWRGVRDVGAEKIFHSFETRHVGQPMHEESDEDDFVASFDREARMKLAKPPTRGTTWDDGPDGELTGSRKQKATRTRQPPKQRGTGKAAGKKKEKPSNNRVQDEKARVGKDGKTKKKPPPSLNNPLLNTESIWAGDVIRDAAGNEEMGALPQMKSGNRRTALMQLISSLPEEHRRNASAGRKGILSAMNDFTHSRAVRTKEGGFYIRGMKSHLKPHQLLCTAFMRRRENDGVEPQGGMCADQMGLGKTVEMIANIVDGMPKKKQRGPKTTTLIVVPGDLVQQWLSELSVHIRQEPLYKLKVMIYRRSVTEQSGPPLQQMEDADIVLTTYNEVRISYPKAEFPITLQTAEDKQRWWKDYYETSRGWLHRMDFLRVVLDEAHYIKNHKSHTSMACRDLAAKYRWALSGTPIQNSIQELYPYFKFLRIPSTGSYKVFRRNFVGTDKVPSKLGIDRLNQLLGRFMIRRTHADKVLGMPIVVLPKASEQIRWVKFNDVERSIYEIVRARMIKRINKLSRSKELDANYSHVLTMLLRLRQLTGHILTVESAMRDLLEQEDHQKIFDLAELEADDVKNDIRSKQLRRVRALLARGEKDNNHNHHGRTRFPGVKDKNRLYRRDSANTTTENDDEHLRDEDMSSGLPDPQNIGGLHGLQYDFTKYLKTLHEDKDLEALKIRTTCCVCGDMPQGARITDCYHVYCAECLEQVMLEAAETGQDGARCKECGVVFGDVNIAENGMDFDAADKKRKLREGYDAAEESDSDTEMQKSGRRGKTRQEKKQKKPDWIDMEGKHILPSAKTIEIKAQVLNWIAENPDVKIIIFTQFVNMIRILKKVCLAEGWPYTLYYGGINMKQRQENIGKFQKNREIKILLSSLKCGGIGLNLTMAQKVIVVDPWWNSSVEQQAFCRVFRIGQDEETSLTRFVVENTVDQNMIEMQQRKQDEIDQVMDCKKKAKTRLEVKDLLKMFGNEVGEDEDGQPFIFVEDKETRLNPGAEDDVLADEE